MTVDLGGFTPDGENDERYQRAKREFGEKAQSIDGFPGLAQAKALYRLMCDGKQPWHRRGLAAAAVLYLVIPLDVVPDCIPCGGLMDDLAVIMAVVLILSGVIDAYSGRRREMSMFFACAEHMSWGVMLAVVGLAAGLWGAARKVEIR